jgi:hypothetical protein
MAKESRVGWPMLRERIAALCGNVVKGLQNEYLLAATNDHTMAERVAGIIQKRQRILKGECKAKLRQKKHYQSNPLNAFHRRE